MTRKILLVDDDQILLKALENRFTEFADQFEIITATDGFDACKKLEKVAVSLILLDLIMPRMDGMSLLTHVRERYPDIPVIFMSSMAEAELRGLAENCEVRGYICKPFNKEGVTPVILKTLKEDADGGIIYDISPGVFLQLMEMEAKTCTIRIFDNESEEGGVLFFSDGQLLDARVGLIRGIDAAYKIFSWQTTTMYIQKQCLIAEDNIKSDLGPIIMHAATLHDEAEADFDDEDEEGSLDGPFGLGALDGPGGVADEKGQDESVFDRLRALLVQRLGPGYEPELAQDDSRITQTVEEYLENDMFSGLGDLKVVSLEGETVRLIIAEDKPFVLRFSPDCERGKIIDVLMKEL